MKVYIDPFRKISFGVFLVGFILAWKLCGFKKAFAFALISIGVGIHSHPREI